MSRQYQLVGDFSPQTKVVEIGALCRPTIAKRAAQVFYVDYASKAFLAKRYQNDPDVDVDAIVEVDGIWGGQDLKTVVGDFGPVDIVIASHVAEHVPDLISWLREISEILKPGGFVGLAIPDRDATFDRLRRLSTLSDLLENYLVRRRIPSALQVLDHVVNVDLGFLRAPEAIAEAPNPSQLRVEDLRGLEALVADINSNGVYHDVHCNTFTALSFASLMLDISSLQLVDLSCATMFASQSGEGEFIVRLRKGTSCDDIVASWRAVLESLRQVRAEKSPDDVSISDLNLEIESRLSKQKMLAEEQFNKGYEEGLRKGTIQLADANQTISEMMNSRSWRLTRPYRWLGKIFRSCKAILIQSNPN
jgi:SAM-dependent methyltransferase